MIACNEESDPDAEFTYGSTLVKSFKLQRDDSILVNLDSVYFSIDLVNGKIFNADSLPYGTKIDKLLISLTTDNCSEIKLHIPNTSGSDSVINYMTNSTDSINFAKGPVKLHLVSFDGRASRDYMIYVNVHKVVPDSLYWSRVERRDLPTSLSVPTAQKTVKLNGKAVCLTSNASGYCIATTDAPALDEWSFISPAFTFTPDISTLSATDNDLYILEQSTGTLYRSTDSGSTWTSTGVKMVHLYGGYADNLLGVTETASGELRHATFSGSQLTVNQNPIGGCPVSGTSQMAMFDSKWSAAPQLIMVGGRAADGTLTNETWGYDGNSWAKLSDAFPVKAEGITLISYKVTATDSLSWTSSQTPALLAFGGRTANGVNSDLYISRDFGMNWKKGDSNLQLPSYITASYDAQALIFDTEFTETARSRAWKALLPQAVKPITQWSAPYIYLFGGRDFSGRLINSIWRGVINSLTFKPLQ